MMLSHSIPLTQKIEKSLWNSLSLTFAFLIISIYLFFMSRVAIPIVSLNKMKTDETEV